MRAIEEHPRPFIYLGTGAVITYKWLIFDPYRRCSMFVMVLTALSTYALIWGFMYISFEAWNLHIQEALKTLTSLAGLFGTVFTSYSVYKNLKTRKRKRKIVKKNEGKKD